MESLAAFLPSIAGTAEAAGAGAAGAGAAGAGAAGAGAAGAASGMDAILKQLLIARTAVGLGKDVFTKSPPPPNPGLPPRQISSTGKSSGTDQEAMLTQLLAQMMLKRRDLG